MHSADRWLVKFYQKLLEHLQLGYFLCFSSAKIILVLWIRLEFGFVDTIHEYIHIYETISMLVKVKQNVFEILLSEKIDHES